MINIQTMIICQVGQPTFESASYHAFSPDMTKLKIVATHIWL